jgi:hypothetical protein
MKWYSGKVCFAITNKYTVPYPVSVRAGNVVAAVARATKAGAAAFHRNHPRARIGGVTVALNLMPPRDEPDGSSE